MIKVERHHEILSTLNSTGKALTNELAERFNVTEDTIRKDFNQLAKQGLIKRVHGGAVNIQGDIMNFSDRMNEYPIEKSELGKVAVDLVANKNTLFVDSGTTNLEFVKLLIPNYSGSIITNSPYIALETVNNDKITTNIIGGYFDPTTKVISGTNAVRQISEINIDTCILGVSSVSLENGITYPSFEESMIKRTLIEQSKNIIVLLVKEKIETVATYYCADLSEISTIITNETDVSTLKKYEELGINIITVESLD